MKDISLKVQRSKLDSTIAQYQKKGYTPITITENLVTMRKKKQFQTFLFVVCFLLFVIPALLVILSYAVDSDGMLSIRIVD